MANALKGGCALLPWEDITGKIWFIPEGQKGYPEEVTAG